MDPFGIFEEMHWLNEIFTDPNIVKVLHGADRDVLWLQRDFSVFFVNMFDTGPALYSRSCTLQTPSTTDICGPSSSGELVTHTH